MPGANWLETLLAPVAEFRAKRLADSAVPLLAASAVLVLAATWAMPQGYSWLALSISESAAQGLEHAWIARLAFVCFGMAVLALAIAARSMWPRLTYGCSLVFALAMLAAAAFSHAPWLPDVAVDEFEDFLHSVAATGMGFAYCIGVLARLARRPPRAYVGRTLDIVSLTIAIVLPLLLAAASEYAGLVQRIMFGVAYAWFGREALLAGGRLREGTGVR